MMLVSEQFKDIEGVFFAIAFEFHLESEVGITMEPATLIDIFRPYCDKPVLSVAHIRAKLHNHVCKLVEIGSCAEVLHCFVLEKTDLLRRESMHLYHLQCLSIELEWKLELL